MKISELEKEVFKDEFWNMADSQEVLKEMTVLKKSAEEYNNLNNINEDVQMLIEFIEMGDTSFEEELKQKIGDLETEIQNFKIKLLLDEKYDVNDVILTINSGAG